MKTILSLVYSLDLPFVLSKLEKISKISDLCSNNLMGKFKMLFVKICDLICEKGPLWSNKTISVWIEKVMISIFGEFELNQKTKRIVRDSHFEASIKPKFFLD